MIICGVSCRSTQDNATCNTYLDDKKREAPSDMARTSKTSNRLPESRLRFFLTCSKLHDLAVLAPSRVLPHEFVPEPGGFLIAAADRMRIDVRRHADRRVTQAF